jgi:hypothetical protein
VTRVGASERGQQTSFKSLLILIRSEDICQSVPFILLRTTDQALARFWRATSHDRMREMIFPIHAFLSRHSFSVGGSLIRTADQARGKVGSRNLPKNPSAECFPVPSSFILLFACGERTRETWNASDRSCASYRCAFRRNDRHETLGRRP